MCKLLKFFSVLATISLAIAGARSASCRSSDIVVHQTRTGRIVEGKPEYEVNLSNLCHCQQSRVVVRCYGLSSVEAVDPRSIKPLDEERCLVGGGRPIAPGALVRFKYAWLTPQDFPLVASKILC
ncbi:TPD1 protein homolog 1-like [Dendrobium catenatum]|uniref:Uncharacterized protein n=2 Tax=Dendrobium TaxID=37818 RepID=A0A8T3BLW1_DENNO|nr:TPD1 protein homolog 1-like [Dendrobium catenatum]KAI0513573.1 hypothetical protein KFK09_009598 [Dendrobium nobile]PKU68618.1 hypothetical protein MA16_Dca023706 [Dendrobium catenatum]